MRLSIRIVLLLLSVTFLNCSNEDNLSTKDGLFSCKLNGEYFEATNIEQSTLLHVSGLQRYDIRAENDKYKIVLAIELSDNKDCMPNGDYKNNTNGREVLMIIYYKRSDNINISVHDPYEDEFGNTTEVVSITNCTNGLISGTFSGSFYHDFDEPDYPKELEITEGFFQNIEFINLNAQTNQ